jgi:uncharacterized membrane protein YbhN (UPF0104 family)
MQKLVFDEKLSFYIKSYFKGLLFSQVLPGSIGGDAARIIELKQNDYSAKEAFYGIFVDRVIGLLGLLILNLIANLLFYGTFPKWLFQLINLITLSGIGGFIVLMNIKHIHFLGRFKGLDLFYRLSHRLNELYASKKLLAYHLVISMTVHLFSVLAIYSLAVSFGVDLSLQVFLIAVPPIFLLTIVPISLAGWGVRESAMVGILMLVGASEASILSISIIYGLILIITALPGAYFWTTSKKITSTELNNLEETLSKDENNER